MEGNNNKDSQYPYSFPPPTWVDPYQPPSSSSSSVPNWVIAAIVIAVVILVFFLFWYVRRREKKIKKKAAKAEAAKAAAEKAKAAKAQAAKEDPSKKDVKPKPNPTPEQQIYIPNTCQSCGHAAGIYTFTYLCPWCKYKAEIALAYPGPSGKK